MHTRITSFRQGEGCKQQSLRVRRLLEARVGVSNVHRDAVALAVLASNAVRPVAKRGTFCFGQLKGFAHRGQKAAQGVSRHRLRLFLQASFVKEVAKDLLRTGDGQVSWPQRPL